MAEYIEREALLKEVASRMVWTLSYVAIYEAVQEAPAADVVEVETVAQMFCDAFGDHCACNYNDNDEWLSAVCDYDFDECPDPKDPLGCWKQFIKHYRERKNDGNNNQVR